MPFFLFVQLFHNLALVFKLFFSGILLKLPDDISKWGFYMNELGKHHIHICISAEHLMPAHIHVNVTYMDEFKGSFMLVATERNEGLFIL